MDALISWGVPATVFSAVIGLIVWLLKRYIDKKERDRTEHDQNVEKLMLMIMQNGRAAVVLARATAMAVQRIPDAHCNGDMTSALAEADKIQNEEKDFLMNQGIQHIFEN